MKAPVGFLVPMCALAILALGGLPARAADLGTANALFQRGKALVDAGNYADACPLLEQAQRLVLGIGVTLYLADCYEHTGRLTPAWEEFEIARRLAETKHDARVRVARERAESLLPRVPKVIVVVPPSVDAPGLELTEDDVVLDRRSYDTERPAMPGTHRFRLRASDRTLWEASVEVPESAGTVRVEVPQLADSQPAAATSTPRQEVGATSSQPPTSDVALLMARPKPMPTQRIAGFAVLGVGAVSLTVGAVLGLEAKAKMDDSNASGHCQPNDHCDAAGLAERSDAITMATWSTVAAVGGAACVLGGAVLYFTARDALPASGMALSARPQRGGASLSIEGRW